MPTPGKNKNCTKDHKKVEEYQTKPSQMPQHGFFTRDLAPHLLPGHGGMVPLSDTVRARNVVTACEIGALRAGTSCSELTLNLKTCEVKPKLDSCKKYSRQVLLSLKTNT